MIEENEQKLMKDHPEIFRSMYDSNTRLPIMFGIECKDGWYSIIDSLCNTIELICRQKDCEIPEAHQVKEKWGSLRFYVGDVDDSAFEKIDGAINMSEEQSLHTCEMCGSTSDDVELRKDGWWRVRCDDCYQTSMERMKE